MKNGSASSDERKPTENRRFCSAGSERNVGRERPVERTIHVMYILFVSLMHRINNSWKPT
jgi:hypothetical protein